MHKRVVLRAEKHQVIQRRFTAVRPVLDMMTVQEAMIVATGELATAIISRP